MEIVGKIIHALPEVSGVSKAGNPWKKREYVLETLENYPRQVFFDFFGDRADQYPLQVGQTIKLFFDIESREYNGRWFTSIRGWKVEDPNSPGQGTAIPQPQYGASAPAAAPAAPAAAAPAPGAFPPPPAPAEAADDLPF